MYTVPFLSLHALAAVRGDGLHPELLALLERLAAASNAGPAVVDFSGYQTDEVLQSGRIPVLPEHATVPESVSRFPAVRDLASYDRMPARTEVQAMAVRQQETDCSIERVSPS